MNKIVHAFKMVALNINSVLKGTIGIHSSSFFASLLFLLFSYSSFSSSFFLLFLLPFLLLIFSFFSYCPFTYITLYIFFHRPRYDSIEQLTEQLTSGTWYLFSKALLTRRYKRTLPSMYVCNNLHTNDVEGNIQSGHIVKINVLLLAYYSTQFIFII